MLGSFLVLLREGFEATLLVAIVLAYLVKIGRRSDLRQVWYGVGAAVLASVVVGGVLYATAGSLEGASEVLFEAGTMWLAVGFLTYMVLWMKRQSRTVASGIRHGVDEAVAGGSALAVAGLVFVMTFREGLETALFMFGLTQASTPLGVGVGGIFGVLGAVALGYAVYAGGKRVDLGAFFKVTGALLILVAAGLLARGVEELSSGGIIPSFFPLWDVSRVGVLTSESVLGQFLTAFTGWNVRPDVLELVVWLLYVAVVGYLFLRPERPVLASDSRQAARVE